MKVAEATNLITTNAVNRMNLFSSPHMRMSTVTMNIAAKPQQTLRFLPILGWSMILDEKKKAATSTIDMRTIKRYLKFWLLWVRVNTLWSMLGSRIMTPQQMKQTENQEERRRIDDSLYFQLNISEMGMLAASVTPSSSFIKARIYDLGIQGMLFSLHMKDTVSQTYSPRRCTHKYLKLYRPCTLCQYIAYIPGKHIKKRRVRHELLWRKYHPRNEVARQPPDQYTLDFDMRVALTEAGDISVIQEADRGKHMPIPIPQKNLARRKELKFQQIQEKRPKRVCMPASQVMKAYLPNRSEQTCRYDPMATPKQTIVISRDCSNFPSCHSSASTGSSNPSTIVSHPSLKRSRQRDLLIFYCAKPQPILVASR